MGRKSGQVWSIELSLTITLFFVALVVFGMIVLKKNPTSGELVSDAEKTMQYISSSGNSSFIDKNVLDRNKALTTNYSQLKKELGIKSDVCIYFEDKEGRIVQINGKNSLGEGNITVNGASCGN